MTDNPKYFTINSNVSNNNTYTYIPQISHRSCYRYVKNTKKIGANPAYWNVIAVVFKYTNQYPL